MSYVQINGNSVFLMLLPIIPLLFVLIFVELEPIGININMHIDESWNIIPYTIWPGFDSHIHDINLCVTIPIGVPSGLIYRSVITISVDREVKGPIKKLAWARATEAGKPSISENGCLISFWIRFGNKLSLLDVH